MSGIEQLESQLQTAARIVEDQLDAELQKLDQMGEDDLERIRQQRIQAMKKQSKLRQEWMAKGHGEYSELTEEKEFFETTKKSENVVCHFYRQSTFRCKIVDKHLDLLARKHVEARFVKIEAERAPFLTRRLNIRIIPTILLIHEGKTKDYIIGFTDLGNKDDFSTERMEWRIAQAGVIEYAGDLLNPPDEPGHGSGAKKSGFLLGKTKIIRGGDGDSDDDENDKE